MRTYHRWILFISYATAVAAVCLVPSSVLAPMTPKVDGIDLAGHFVLFGGIAVLFRYAAMRPGHPVGRILNVSAVALGAAYGLLIECLQAALRAQTGRTFDWWDFIADTAGAIACVAVIQIFSRKHQPTAHIEQ